MGRLVRIFLVIASAAVVLAGTLTGLVVLGQGLLGHASSSQADPLLPIGTSTLEGSTVYADDGTTVLATLRGPEIRRPVKLSQVSKTLIKAVLDTEDARFYIHGGFDIPSTLRALASDSSGGGLQGGSTITQQLVKQTYLSPARKVSRKIKEAVLAERLQQKYTKDQILEAYLNIIYLGNSAYGVQAAANVYFNEDVSQVNIPQAALLAGLIQNPSGYDPLQQPLLARTRRAEVLARMVHYKDITQAQADAANATALPTAVTKPPASTDLTTNYYVREVVNELLGANSPIGGNYNERYQALFEGGLKIYTDYDPKLQNLAETAVARDTPTNNGGFEQAMVVIDPATGKVKAMVGGSATGSSAQYNVITEGTRQPGSGFKLFTLIAALEAGYSPLDTIDATAPCAIAFPGNLGFVPPQDGGPPGGKAATNDEGDGSGGTVTLVKATAQSLNCGFLRLGHEVGLPAIAAVAKEMGITTPLGAGAHPTSSASLVPSMILGSIGVHPIDIASAYATVAAGGVYHRPTFIDHITDKSGNLMYTGEAPAKRLFSAQIAAEAELCLNAVVSSGTGSSAALYNRPVAGKTGTTSGPTDAWFNGFVPQLEATVWMGNPNNTNRLIVNGAQVYGGMYPTRTWHDFMYQALADVPVAQFFPVDYGALPQTKYITSPQLAIDDKSAHGGYYNPNQYNPNQQSYNNNNSGGYYTTPATTGAVATTVTTTPPATAPSPPPTAPAATTATTKPPKKG
ncbi:penicillin-binding protein [Acidiferrimicrobium sp. IK]|uniref:transglycosylase domain-containing protein n=1 Tax=Acidiferrimicrobium sp. IK TaxID=2871700 RepID=UPI0021CB4CB3|nr:transglycosylase domain-containing protein [Acidiferrimicrobium sp. IK]MCU4183987.1 penicillin-binding protein [Acidiferrimicrobium sp. IK]